MKTAISLPDDAFDAADQKARELGMSRSEFFATAARRYLEDLDRSSLTQQINEALEHLTLDESAAAAVASGRARLNSGDDW